MLLEILRRVIYVVGCGFYVVRYSVSRHHRNDDANMGIDRMQIETREHCFIDFMIVVFFGRLLC